MQTFDIIIVGAGSAGCVLAHRLSADPACRVLLLEAGPPDRSPFIHMPKGSGKTLTDPRYHWANPVYVDPPRNLDELWRRGKTLGGSSAVNGLVYTRGFAPDYDAWKLPGWGWQEMLAAFKAIEDFESGDPRLHGHGGPLHVSLHDEPTEVQEAMIGAGVALGLKRATDLTAEDVEQVGYVPRTIKGGRRWTSATAFLKPVLSRPNLTVRTDLTVDQLVIENRRAVGVKGRSKEGAVELRAVKEVILAAGALNSPKLLMLSGIGPGKDLQALGIPVRHDSPQLGRRLQEQVMTMTSFRLNRNIGCNRELRGLRLVKNLITYYTNGRGVMAWAPFEMAAFVKVLPESERPDVQIGMASLSINLKRKGYGDVETEPGIMMFCYQLNPESRGWLRLSSSDPEAPLDIFPNYLATATDRRAAIGGLRTIRRLVAAGPLAALVEREVMPGVAAQSDDELLLAFRSNSQTAYHAVGTCAMGTEPDAVTDARLRVRGVDGLRVVDAGVMPALPGAHTNGQTMALAWRAADLIIEDLR